MSGNVGYLTIKRLGEIVKPWRITKQNSHILGRAKTSDYIKGFSPKKGNFEIISYKDKDGRLIYRRTIYSDKNEEIVKNFNYEDYLTYINIKTTKNGQLSNSTYKTLRKYDDKSIVEFSEQLGNLPEFDVQNARYLKPKQKPRVINVEDPWINPKINIQRCSVGRATMLKDKAYLPTCISNISKERTNERIASIEKVLAHKNDISINRTQTKRVSQNVLNPERTEGTFYGDCDWNGKVRIWDKLYTTPDLYETMGHEFNHSKVLENMEKYETNRTTGLGRKANFTAKKIVEEYDMGIENIPYKDRLIERLAFSEEEKIRQKFFDMFDNIKKFFDW